MNIIQYIVSLFRKSEPVTLEDGEMRLSEYDADTDMVKALGEFLLTFPEMTHLHGETLTANHITANSIRMSGE